MKHLIRGIAFFMAITFFISPMPATWAHNAPQALNNVTNLSGVLAAGGEVNSYDLSPDGNYAVFRADKDLVGTMELYSVNLQTLAVVKLNSNLSDGYDVSNIVISPNSQWVVYKVNNSSSGSYLKSVPIGGGTPNNISHPLLGQSRHVRDFEITPDSANVIFTCDLTTEDYYDLYRSPITGVYLALPPGTPLLPEKLNTGLPANYYVYSFDVSPDGTFIIFRDQWGGYGYSVWHVPVSGGTNTKISTDVASFHMRDFLIAPNSQRVVYRMMDGSYSLHRFYSVLAAGGTATRLDNPSLTEGFTDQYRISNDSAYMVFTGSLDDANKMEIYSAPIAGPAASMKKLNGNLVSGGNIDCGLTNSYFDFAISPDSANVVYCADYIVDGRYEIFKILTSGNSVITRLSQTPSVGNGAYTFTISPDSKRVLYNGHFNNENYHEAFSIPMSGGTPAPLADFALANQRSVFWMTIAPDSSHVVLEIGTSDGSTEGYRLYKTPLTGGLAGNMTPNPTNTGHVYFRNEGFTPDSQKVIVISDMGTDWVDELFMVEYDFTEIFLPVTINP